MIKTYDVLAWIRKCKNKYESTTLCSEIEEQTSWDEKYKFMPKKNKKYKSHDDYIIFLKIKSKKIFRDNKYLVS